MRSSTDSDGKSDKLKKLRKTVLLSVALGIGMFGFGFALVPLYDVFCRITGLNGKLPDTPAEISAVSPVTERSVRVQFITHNNESMPWEFKPVTRQIKVHPGQYTDVLFMARNLSTQDMVGQAVPSVSPSESNTFFLKTECFCFERQPLKAGESTEMQVRFMVDTELPEHIQTITLSYTLFDVTEKTETTKI